MLVFSSLNVDIKLLFYPLTIFIPSQVEQYKHERECNSIIGQLQEDKIARLENLMDGVLSAEEFVNEELTSLANEHQVCIHTPSRFSQLSMVLSFLLF